MPKKIENNPTLSPQDGAIQELIEKVVAVLKPHMDTAINGKFDEIKTLVVNELRDVRATQPQPMEIPQLQQPMVMPQSQPQTPQGMDLIGTILPLVQSIMKPQENNSMSNLLAEAMMRKMLSDTSRSEVLNQAMMNHLFKQVFKDDTLLNEYNKTADSFMSPITKFGSIKEKQKESEKP